LLAVAGAKQQGDGKSQPAEDGMDGASHRTSVMQSCNQHFAIRLQR
jgi:hypothetical protein